MGTRLRRAAFVMALGVLAVPASATATAIDSTLTSVNGEGERTEREVLCPAEPGPFWSYAWSGAATAAQSTLAGTWNGFTRVHEGGFIQPGAGRVEVSMARGGVARFEFEGGDCLAPSLTIGTQPDGDRVATGTLPLRPTLSTGAARGLAGSGRADVSLELGGGADNVASIRLRGDFDVRDPQLSIGRAYGRWNSLGDYLNKRLTVHITIHNAGGEPLPGNAYGVRLTEAFTSGAHFTGLPAAAPDIPAGGSGLARVTLNNASPGKTYGIFATATGRDGLDAPQPAVQGSTSVQASLLP